ncbi:hypothetical protein PV327_007619 [Microctonus hyperodae]|uniref:Uncharacterized protein n=1 Tax=Microctonus hyperodae TaxID=165561 RepID=A0AA39FZU2_MICHY|nr:hypothetical protein PV327_007619 [Microctonus hyperodae]
MDKKYDRISTLNTAISTFHNHKSISATSLRKSSEISLKLNRHVNYTSMKNSSNEKNPENQQNKKDLLINGDIDIINQTTSENDIHCVCYTETFDYIAAGLSNGIIKMMNVNNGNFEFALHDNEMVHNSDFTTAIKHRRVQTNRPLTQTLTATYANGCVKCWHYPTGRCIYKIRENREILNLFYHPLLTKFVTVGDNAISNLYDEETKTLERIFCTSSSSSSGKIRGHKSRVYGGCFHPKSYHEFITGGWDETIQFWDSRQAHATRQIIVGRICGDSLDISTNGKEILVCCGSKENAIQLWDYGSGKCIVTIEPDTWNSCLNVGKYIGKLFIACGGGDENIFRIVDLRFHSTAGFIKNLSGAVNGIDIGPNLKLTKQRISISNTLHLPKIAFCCGKTLFEIKIH